MAVQDFTSKEAMEAVWSSVDSVSSSASSTLSTSSSIPPSSSPNQSTSIPPCLNNDAMTRTTATPPTAASPDASFPLQIHLDGKNLLNIKVNPYKITLHNILSLLTQWNLLVVAPCHLHVNYEGQPIDLSALRSLQEGDASMDWKDGEDEEVYKMRLSRPWNKPLFFMSLRRTSLSSSSTCNDSCDEKSNEHSLKRKLSTSSSNLPSTVQEKQRLSNMLVCKDGRRVHPDSTSATGTSPTLNLYILSHDPNVYQGAIKTISFSDRAGYRLYPKYAVNEAFVYSHIHALPAGKTPKVKHLRRLWCRLQFLLRGVDPASFAEHLLKQHSLPHIPPSSLEHALRDIPLPTTKGQMLSLMIEATSAITPDVLKEILLPYQSTNHKSVELQGSKETLLDDPLMLDNGFKELHLMDDRVTSPSHRHSKRTEKQWPEMHQHQVVSVAFGSSAFVKGQTLDLLDVQKSATVPTISSVQECKPWLWLVLLQMANTFVNIKRQQYRTNAVLKDMNLGIHACCSMSGMVDAQGSSGQIVTPMALKFFFDQLWLLLGDTFHRPIRTWTPPSQGDDQSRKQSDHVGCMEMWLEELAAIAFSPRSMADGVERRQFPDYIVYWVNHELYSSILNHTLTQTYRQQYRMQSTERPGSVFDLSFVPFSVPGYHDVEPDVFRYNGIDFMDSNSIQPGNDGKYMFSVQALCFAHEKHVSNSMLPFGSGNHNAAFSPLFTESFILKCIRHWMSCDSELSPQDETFDALDTMLKELGLYSMYLLITPGQEEHLDQAVIDATSLFFQLHDYLSTQVDSLEKQILRAPRRASIFHERDRLKTKSDLRVMSLSCHMHLKYLEKVSHCAFDLFVQKLRLDLIPAGQGSKIARRFSVLEMQQRISDALETFKQACLGQYLNVDPPAHLLTPDDGTSSSSKEKELHAWNALTKDILVAWQSEERIEFQNGYELMRTLQARFERVISLAIHVTSLYEQYQKHHDGQSKTCSKAPSPRGPCDPLAVPFVVASVSHYEIPENDSEGNQPEEIIFDGQGASPVPLARICDPEIVTMSTPDCSSNLCLTPTMSPSKPFPSKAHLKQLLEMTIQGFSAHLGAQQDALIIGIRRLLLEALGTPMAAARHLHLVRTPGSFIAFVYSRKLPTTNDSTMLCGSKRIVPSGIALVFSRMVAGYVRCIPFEPRDPETYPNLPGDQPAFEKLLWHVHQMQYVMQEMHVSPEDFHVQWIDETIESFYRKFREHLMSPIHQDVLTPPLETTASRQRRPSQVFWPGKGGSETKHEPSGLRKFIHLPYDFLGEKLNGITLYMNPERAFYSQPNESLPAMTVTNPTINKALFFPVNSVKMRSACSCG